MSSKAMFALHRDDLGPLLVGEPLHRRVAGAGAHRLQVNLDDGDVADAPLRFGPGTPIQAVVSVWTDGDVADAAAILREVDPSADGWLVEERRPLEPPPVADGVRADALANIAFLRRPAAMSPQDWRTDWLGRHTAIAIRTQGTFGYVQNPVLGPITPATSPGAGAEVAGIVEELFPMAAMTDSHAFYGSGGDEEELKRRFTELMDSVALFGADQGLDLVPTSRYLWNLG
jgi:hypothetical protein